MSRKILNVLIMGEYSGVSRDAFIKAGHNAMSCDLLPTEVAGPHYQGDVRNIINGHWGVKRWDLLIAHPDCTFLTNSAAWALKDGPYHQKVKLGTLVGAARRAAQAEALEFVRFLLNAEIDHICLENPIGAIGTAIRKASQYIQPNEYGHDASKITGLWLKNLPLLKPTHIIEGRLVEWPKNSGKFIRRWGNQTDSGQNKLTPSEDRWKERARTYEGWAEAFVTQWSNYILNQLNEVTSNEN